MRNLTILHGGVMHMINQRRILALLLSLFLTLGAGPAWAVSFVDSFTAASSGSPTDPDTEEMTPSATTFCFLSQVTVRDTDTFEELGSCSIEEDAFEGKWVLRAFMGEDNDAAVFCQAFCFNI
jgi:hypothetical protein